MPAISQEPQSRHQEKNKTRNLKCLGNPVQVGRRKMETFKFLSGQLNDQLAS